MSKILCFKITFPYKEGVFSSLNTLLLQPFLIILSSLVIMLLKVGFFILNIQPTVSFIIAIFIKILGLLEVSVCFKITQHFCSVIQHLSKIRHSRQLYLKFIFA